ncbi:hypothetical protein [Luteipulveratus halotolerans]|uniref:Uncharacterized protein n=1 Tax=Luteipulveratus halotolerans TaxID=1631356 RepID=A0A0L6CQ78_9MICO|nr:hypothetical protein [Luteipulveratus halotolerans]KNX39693.1 hypothetical protein VV01_00195 [Luteipulveratus halotolerans]
MGTTSDEENHAGALNRVDLSNAEEHPQRRTRRTLDMHDEARIHEYAAGHAVHRDRPYRCPHHRALAQLAHYEPNGCCATDRRHDQRPPVIQMSEVSRH